MDANESTLEAREEFWADVIEFSLLAVGVFAVMCAVIVL